MANKFLDGTGLAYVWATIKSYIASAISVKADKANTVTGVNYDATNKKITKTINGTTSDVVTVAEMKSDMTFTASDVGLDQLTNDAQVKRTEMGAANGVATLDGNGLVPSSQLPSYVDDVVEAYARSGQIPLSATWLAYDSLGTQVITPESGKIYVLMADVPNSEEYLSNSQYRWGGSAYVKLNDGGVSPITTAEIDEIMTEEEP